MTVELSSTKCIKFRLNVVSFFYKKSILYQIKSTKLKIYKFDFFYKIGKHFLDGKSF